MAYTRLTHILVVNPEVPARTVPDWSWQERSRLAHVRVSGSADRPTFGQLSSPLAETSCTSTTRAAPGADDVMSGRSRCSSKRAVVLPFIEQGPLRAVR